MKATRTPAKRASAFQPTQAMTRCRWKRTRCPTRRLPTRARLRLTTLRLPNNREAQLATTTEAEPPASESSFFLEWRLKGNGHHDIRRTGLPLLRARDEHSAQRGAHQRRQ